MSGRRPGAGFLKTALLVAMLAGCSGGGSKERPLDSYTAEEIYKKGELELETGKRPKDALVYFQEVERLYPYTEFAKRALIMQAYTHHRAKEYPEARDAAQRYLDFYPGDEDAPYALYLMALSYYDQIDDVGRDQGITFQALSGMRDVIETYPDSEYARSAMLKFELAFDQLAGKEMEVGRYYLDRRQYIGAVNRFKVVVQEYQTTRHIEEALERLTEAYYAMGIVDEAQTAAAVLGHNYPDSRWYKDAYKLLNTNGLEPRENTQSWISKAFKAALL